jgi:hypothetical protein
MRSGIVIGFLYLCVHALFISSISLAAPSVTQHDLTDQNMDIDFEVHSPWNILDGTAEQVRGNISLAPNGTSEDNIRADISVEKLDYKAGLSLAGRLVAGWLRMNPPLPAKFVIDKSSFNCPPDATKTQAPCAGTVNGLLTIWAKEHNIDVPIETKPSPQGILLTGMKKIKWGEYGFGDNDSTISHLEPVIVLNFSINIPSKK